MTTPDDYRKFQIDMIRDFSMSEGYDAAVKATRDIDVLALISAHRGVFAHIAEHATALYDRLSDVVRDYYDSPARLIMHFPDIRMYGMFTLERYAEFADQMRGERLSARIEQLAYAGVLRRFAVTCNDPSMYGRLAQGVERSFPAYKYALTHGQLVIDMELETANDAWNLYKRLISASGMSSTVVRPLEKWFVDGVEYVAINISGSLEVESCAEWMRAHSIAARSELH